MFLCFLVVESQKMFISMSYMTIKNIRVWIMGIAIYKEDTYTQYIKRCRVLLNLLEGRVMLISCYKAIGKIVL